MQAWQARRSALYAVVFALLFFGAAVAPTTARQPDADYLSWPQEQSDFKPDAAVRYGVLANGMHYALMRNTEPENTASVRLHIAAGSLQEADNQKGLAHFLEHMAFNGSRNFAEGEAVKALQRKGLAFGPHTNARTGVLDTVYILELPSVDASTMDTALRFMRDVADGLNLEQGAIERERGVIMSEERQSDTPERRAFNDRWKRTYEGHQAADRMPIGDMQVIRNATHDLLADFYNRYYRPERATLVLVGQFDLDAMEAKVKADFSDWKRGTSADGNYGTVEHPHLRAVKHIETNLADDVTVSWVSAPDTSPDTTANRRERDIRDLGLAVINRRLDRMARTANAPFVSASAGRGVLQNIATIATLNVNTRPGRWSEGMTATEQALRRALQYGVRQDEIDREIAVVKAQLMDAAARADTRYNKALADTMIDFLGDRRVFTNPRDDVAIFTATTEGLSAATVNEALRACFTGDPSLIFVSSGLAISGGDDAVRTAYLSAHETAVADELAVAAKDFPYTEFGKPGAVVSRQRVDDLGVTLVRFANGVRLNVKPTEFERDSIAVKIHIAGGYLAIPRKAVGLYWAVPFAYIEGGLGKLTTDELEQSLAGRITSADLSLDEDAFELSGATNRRDLNLQLQLLAAFANDPAYRSEGLVRLQGAAENFLKQFASSPGRVLQRELPAALRSGDTRWRFPTLAEIKAITMRDAQALMSPALRNAPLEVTIVGDVDVDAAIDAVARTFGTLARRDDSATLPRDVHFPSAYRHLKFSHEGRVDQAVAYASWAGPDFPSSPRLSRTLVLLRDMIKVRLNDEFREKQGATYSPFASSWASGAIPGFGFVAAGSETPPREVAAFYDTLGHIVKDLRQGKFDDDLVVRARKPLVETAIKDRKTNNYWANALADAQRQIWSMPAIRSYFDDMNAITKAELIAAANKFLTDRRRIDVQVLPKK